jgi:hypothetical protein
MFKRKIEKYLKEWKSDEHKMPLIIKGCRQCGKTFSVLDFAHKNYEHVVYIDFFQHPEYKSVFDGGLDIDLLCMTLSTLIPDANFVSGKTCIIFDEIQECPRARTALKFFKTDGRYDVIGTGSLLGVSGYHTNASSEAPIPVGYETIIDMYPMDFEEWLWANGIKKMTIDYLHRCLEEKTPVQEAIHERMRQLLLQYCIVGGMPRAVSVFMETHNMQNVLRMQQAIIEEYKVDMLKGPASLMYGSDAMAGVLIFHSAPTLAKGDMRANFSTSYQTNNGLFDYSLNFAGNQGGFVWNTRYSGKMAHAYKNKYDGYVFGSSLREQALSQLLGWNYRQGHSHPSHT